MYKKHLSRTSVSKGGLEVPRPSEVLVGSGRVARRSGRESNESKTLGMSNGIAFTLSLPYPRRGSDGNNVRRTPDRTRWFLVITDVRSTHFVDFLFSHVKYYRTPGTKTQTTRFSIDRDGSRIPRTDPGPGVTLRRTKRVNSVGIRFRVLLFPIFSTTRYYLRSFSVVYRHVSRSGRTRSRVGRL
jgi:hypothetical protein